MKKTLAIFCAALSFAACAGSIQVTNLKLEQIDNGTKIKVSWTISNAGTFNSYAVALTRGETPDTPALSRTVVEPYNADFTQSTRDRSMTDTPPKSGKRYYYWLHVMADPYWSLPFSLSYFGDQSVIKSAPCVGPLVGWAGTLADEPKAPTELTATYDTEPTGIELSWNAGENAKTYNVYRGDSEDTGTMNMIGKDYGKLSGTDKNVEPGRDYYYAVKSVNDGTESSDFSPVAKGRRPLLPPTDVKASLVDNDTAAEVTWKAEPLAASYDVYVGLTADFKDATQIANRTVCCCTNVLAGDFAVKSHWYWVVSKNAYTDSKPSDPAKLTVLPPTAVEVYASAADVANGSITLSWKFSDGRELPKGLTFSVARQVNDGKSSLEVLTHEESTMSFTDATWGAAGKTATISYWIQPNVDDWPLSNECETRKRYGVFVGIDRFTNPSANLRNCVNDAQNLKDRFSTDGDCHANRIITNANATKHGILSGITGMAGRICPGDIFLFSASSHGVQSGAICCHNTAERISGQELATAFAGFPTGVGAVIILDVCFADKIAPVSTSSAYPTNLKAVSSGSASDVGQGFDAFIDSFNAALRRRRLTALDSSGAAAIPRIQPQEIGWMTSVAGNETADDVLSYLSACLCDAGWICGGADANDDNHVTFGELASFSVGWCQNAANVRTVRHPSFRNDDVLSAIAAGRCTKKGVFERLTRPRVRNAYSLLGRLTMTWDSVFGAREYAVMRYAEGSSVTSRVATVSNATSWKDGMTEALEPGVTYHYYVAAMNPLDISECSETVSCVATEDPQLVTFLIKAFAGGCPSSVPNVFGGGSVDYAAVNLDHDGDGLTTFQEYVTGTDPLDTNSVFRAIIDMSSGLPDLRWEPDLNTNGVVRDYVLWGKTNLTDAAWHSPTNASSKFFKVEVRLR